MSLEEAGVSADILGSISTLDAARRPCASGARLSGPRDGSWRAPRTGSTRSPRGDWTFQAPTSATGKRGTLHHLDRPMPLMAEQLLGGAAPRSTRRMRRAR
jgi:hypothetical protein